MTTATIRQSSRWLASLPVRQVADRSVVGSSDEDVPIAYGSRAARQVDAEQREHDDDHQAADAAADRHAAAADAAAILDLSCVEPGARAKPHRPSLPGAGEF